MLQRILAAALLTAALGVGMLPGRADALPIDIANADFEAESLPTPGDHVKNAIIGWTGHADAAHVVVNPPTNWFAPGEADGNVVNSKGIDGGEFIAQALDATLEGGVLYQLSAEVGNRLSRVFGGYTIQLVAGDAVVAEIASNDAPADGTFTTVGLAASVEAGDERIGGALSIRFRANSTGDDAQTAFDNFALDATPLPAEPEASAPTVPEPTTLVLLGAAAVCVATRRR